MGENSYTWQLLHEKEDVRTLDRWFFRGDDGDGHAFSIADIEGYGWIIFSDPNGFTDPTDDPEIIAGPFENLEVAKVAYLINVVRVMGE